MSQITRRDMVALSAQSFFALVATLPMLGCMPTDKRAERPAEQRNWERFLEQVRILAEEQFAPAWDQKSYTQSILSVMRELDLTDQHVVEVMSRYRNAHKNFPEIKALHKEHSFMVSLLEFEPGEKIELHDHPDMTGCILCSEGEVRVQNYTLDERKSERGRPLIRVVSDVTMTPGCTGALTSTVANIHALQSVTFTRLIDVFTPPYNDDRSRRSRWYQREPQPYQQMSGLYEVSVRA
jgi:PCO_ADO